MVRGFEPVFPGERCEKRVGQRADVLHPLAQRGGAQREDGEAEVEVLAEPARGHFAGEVLVGRGQHAHIDGHAALTADARDLPGLQRAQHLRLGRELHVADLVEEQRAAVSLLEEATLLRLRSCERASFVSEQLALDQLAGDRGAVDAHEGPALAQGEPVDRAAHELFARPALTEDEHARARRRHPLELAVEPLHGRALADHLVALLDLRGQPHHLAREPRGVELVLHADEHALAAHGLLEEVARAELDRLHRVVDRRVTAHHDHRQLARRVVLADALEQIEAAHARQHQIEDRELHGARAVGEDLQGLLCGRGLRDVVALAA
jgi:hypothetical protein